MELAVFIMELNLMNLEIAEEKKAHEQTQIQIEQMRSKHGRW